MNSWEFLVVGLWELRIPIGAFVCALVLSAVTGKLKAGIFLPLGAVVLWALVRSSVMGWSEPGFHGLQLMFYILMAVLFAAGSAFVPVVIGAFAGRAFSRWRNPQVEAG